MTLDNMSDNTFESKNCQVSSPAPAQQQATAPLDEVRRELRCLVQGDSATFKVTVPLDKNIDDLKDLIYDKGISEKRDVLAKDLVLWKVRTSQRSA
jgi:Crinkler effector protein N-terminal domain